jgi:hypothetical protein
MGLRAAESDGDVRFSAPNRDRQGADVFNGAGILRGFQPSGVSALACFHFSVMPPRNPFRGPAVKTRELKYPATVTDKSHE